MSATLAFERYVDLVAASATRMITTIERAGFDAEVVTCPIWDGRALVAHQAMVHRWAAANLRGEDASAVPNQTEIRESVEDLGTYFRDGVDGLVAALREASDDLDALVFLNDAPPPRQFWARRQAHETTIHMVDALSAKLGQVPSATEAAIDSDVAVDGIDELLCGFFTRGKSKIFEGSEYDVDVVPTDSDRRWTVHVAERMTATAESAGDAHVRIAGPADAIYLALWNRGDEVEVTGDDGLLDRWRAAQRVRWG
ncbi:MAG TPA: maleylpyruvate isomerase family mycothiol-dependent enzyme [Ilumatobacter sp.]|nr:maleylpyruvate isomerase family mycothiol-dependent enzyme [Ilumatobacter sp.]